MPPDAKANLVTMETNVGAIYAQSSPFKKVFNAMLKYYFIRLQSPISVIMKAVVFQVEQEVFQAVIQEILKG